MCLCILLGEPLYESCSNKVAKMLYKKVHKAEEVKDLDFYAFSYYYDCAAEVGLIGMSVFISFKMTGSETNGSNDTHYDAVLSCHEYCSTLISIGY